MGRLFVRGSSGCVRVRLCVRLVVRGWCARVRAPARASRASGSGAGRCNRCPAGGENPPPTPGSANARAASPRRCCGTTCSGRCNRTPWSRGSPGRAAAYSPSSSWRSH
eukprot:3912631-Prymnesium_polylepis.1